MAKDQRLYGKLTLDFPDHPKIAILSDAAFRCLIEATLWSRKQERDGLLPRRYAVAKWSLDVLQELCCNDDQKPSLIERDEGWYVHDFAEHQETKADIEARRERNRAAGQKGGLAKAKRSAKRGAKPPASDVLSENVARVRVRETPEVTTNVVTSSARAKRKTQVADDYMPPAKVVAAIRDEVHGITDERLRYQHRKFIDHWKKTGKPMADWDATWRNWMRTANERGELGNRNSSVQGGQVHKLRAYAELAEEVRATEHQVLKELG